MSWGSGSIGLEFYVKIQYHYPGGNQFGTPKRSGRPNYNVSCRFTIWSQDTKQINADWRWPQSLVDNASLLRRRQLQQSQNPKASNGRHRVPQTDNLTTRRERSQTSTNAQRIIEIYQGLPTTVKNCRILSRTVEYCQELSRLTSKLRTLTSQLQNSVEL